jgi:NADPH-dependent 2,4-dienoyl-CoA reductase/sulfur reductase-like enzyme
VDAIFSSLERSPKTALIVGGGFIGVETAENFALRGIKTTLVEGRSQILPPFDHEMARLLENELVTNGIRLKLGVSLSKFQDNGHTVVLADGETLPADIVILSIGIVPDNVLAKSAGLALSGDGYVLTNEKMETTDMATGKANEDVYAIGDVALLKDYIDGTTTHIALAGPANRQARLVADVINGLPYTYKGAIGTSVLKVFSLTGASTGYSEALCQRKNLPYQSVIIERNQHAGYYPGASIMTLKVVFNPKDGSLWGAQAIGLDGIEKRIDVIATALKAKMTVGDLSELELSYAPPYGSAKDVVNIAAMPPPI